MFWSLIIQWVTSIKMYLTHCSLSTNSIFKPQLIQIVQIVKFKVTKTFMSKMHNLALLMDPCEEAYDTSLKAANMYMTRFCIVNCSFAYLNLSVEMTFTDEELESFLQDRENIANITRSQFIFNDVGSK